MATFDGRPGGTRTRDIDGRSGEGAALAMPQQFAQKPAGQSTGAALRSATALSRGLHLDTLEPRLLLSADLIPVSGSIDLPGETDFYTFDLAEERTILFDALTPEYRFNWSLEGPGGQVVGATRFDQSDGAQGGQLIALEAGSYRMAVDAEGDFTGAYQFRLINIANAEVIALGDAVAGTLDSAGRESDLFQFEAVEGQELFFDAQIWSGGTAYWSLVGPDGTTHFGPTNFTPSADPARFVVPQTGTYSILLEGYIYNSSPASYRFAVNEVTDVTRTIAPDTTVTGRIEAPGQRHRLTFTLDEPGKVWLDSLTPSALSIRMDGPRGVELSPVELRYADWQYAVPVLDLVAGTYTLTIEGDDGQTGDYALQLLTRASARVLERGQAVSDVLDDQDASKGRYRVPSEAGLTGDAGQAQLFDNGSPKVTVAHEAGLTPDALTFETWVRPENISSFQMIAAKSRPGEWTGGYGLYVNSGQVYFYVNDVFYNDAQVAAAIPQGEWSHVAGSYDGAMLRLYLDGELVASREYAQPITHSASALVLGEHAGHGAYRFEGQLDETRLWDRALSDAEIAEGLARRQTGAAAGLVLAYGYDATDPAAVPDLSGNGRDGSLTQGPGTETHLFRLSGVAGERLVFGPAQDANANIRIVAPSGVTIRGPEYPTVLDPLVLPETGEYLIAVEGYPFEGRPVSYSLIAVPPVQADLTLAVNDRVDGTLDAVGAAHAYGFTLTGTQRLMFDALSAQRSDVSWTLIGPRGTEVAARRFNVSDSYNINGDTVLTLPPGDYTLIVDGIGTATGDYAFRLFDLATATAIAYDQTVAVTLNPSSATAAYRFSGTGGERVELTAPTISASFRLLDPFGRQIAGPNDFYGGNSTILQATGQYTLLIEGYPQAASGTVTGTFALSVIDTVTLDTLTGTAMAPGDLVAGNIGTAGETDDFVFTLDAPGQFLFDAIETQEQTTYWTLVGPRGQEVVGRNFYSSDGPDLSQPPVLNLIAGTYRLRIAKDPSVTGAYSFRLHDLRDAVDLTLGTEVTGTLDPARATRVYTFDAAAGARLVFDGASQSGTGYGITARLIDPFGRETLRNVQITNSGVLTLPVAGTYTLLLEGRIYENASNTSSYAFTLTPPAETATALTLGETVGATIGTAFGSDRYTFTLDAQTDVIWDHLRQAGNGTVQILRKGTVLRQFSLFGSDSGDTGTAPLLRLQAGDYSVVVRGNGAERPTYAFRLLDGSTATDVALDTPVTGTLNPARETDIFRFDAPAGTILSFADVTNAGGAYNAYVRLIDGFGRQVMNTRYLQAGSPVTLALGGSYTLLVEGRIWENDTAQISYGFTLETPQDPAPRAVAVEDRITGEISSAGQVHRMTMTLTGDRLLALDSLSNNYSILVRIQGPGGVDRTLRMRDADSGDNGSNIAFRAAAGTYTITAYGENGATGSYDFRLRDLALGTDMVLGDRITGQLSPARETDIYCFDATVGDTFLMDALREDGDIYGVYWRLIDPSGGQEVGPTRLQDGDLRRLQRTGTYTLLIEGRTYEPLSNTIDYAFRLQPATVETRDVTADGTADGLVAIEGPDGRAAQGFTGTEYVVLDDPLTTLTGDVSFDLWIRPDQPQDTWQPIVYKAGGSVATREYTLWLNSSGYLHLTSSDASGQIHVDSPAGSIAWDEWHHVTGVVDRGTDQLRLYINGVLAGQTALRDQPSVSVSQPLFLGHSLEDGIGYLGAMAGFRLYDSALGADEAAALAGGATAAAAGLAPLVDLRMTDAAGAAVLDDRTGALDGVVVDTTAALGGVFKGRLDLAGQVDTYRFSLTEPTWLYWDTLTDRGDIRARLTGPDGIRIDRALNATGESNSAINPLFLAPAGDYELSFDATGAVKAAYGLRLMALEGAEALTYGVPTEGRIDTQRAARAFTFDVAAGDRVFVDMQSLPVGEGSAAWRLFDPFGQQVQVATARDLDGLEFAVAGTWTLVLEGDRHRLPQSPLDYRFAVFRVNTDPVPITIGGTNPGLAPVLTEAVLPGGGLVLRGAEYLEVTDPALDRTGSLTVEMWVRVDRFTDTWMHLLNKVNPAGGQGDHDIYVNANGSIYASTTRADGARETIQTAAGALVAGQWAHVAVVHDRGAGQQRIYVNGTLLREEAMSTQIGRNSGGPLLVGMGLEQDNSYGGFEGAVDDLRLWAAARSGAEIADTYQQVLTGTEDDLILNLPLDEVATDRTTADTSATGAAARLVNMAADGVTGTIAGVGQEVVHTFTLSEPTRVYIDSLTDRNNLRLLLTGPSGTIVDRHFAQVDSEGIANPVFLLPAGDYRLLVQGAGDAQGNFNFILRDLADARPLTLGTPVDDVLLPSNRTAIWQFDGAAGQQVFLDSLAVTGGLRWKIIDPLGNLTLGNVAPDDRGGVTLPMDGPYTLLVEGLYYWWGQSTYRLAIYDQTPPAALPLTLGAATTAVIPTPGQSQSYAFTLDSAARVLMDVSANASTLRWSLTGPDGSVVSDRRFDQTDARNFTANPLLALGPGDYTLTVRATDDFTGDIAFRLFDADAAATEIVFDDEVLGTLPDDGRGTRVFRLTGERHQAFAMDMIARPGNNTAWRLIGPGGTQVVGVRSLADEGGFVLPEAGDYLLLIEGSVADAPSTNTYRFELVTPEGAPATGATREDFGAGSGIAHVVTTHAGATAAEETTAGETVLRLLDPLSANQRSTVAFGATAPGRQQTIAIGFDFTLSAPATGSIGNGFAALLLPTATYGSHGAVPAFGLEPNLANVLAAVVDLVQGSGDGAVPHLSLHFGREVIEVPLADLGLDPVGTGRFFLSATRVAGGAEVSVTMDMGGGAVTVLDGVFVAGFDMADRRLAVHAENGSATTAGLTIDAVTIATTSATTGLVAAPGDILAGDVAQPGAVDRWQLVLSEPAHVAFDALTNNGNLRWSLTGPVGIGATGFQSTDGYFATGNPYVLLPAGTYDLAVFFAGDQTGSYQLALRDRADATPVALDTATTVTLDPANRQQTFRFAWPGGETPLYIEASRSAGAQSYYRLIGPGGEVYTQQRGDNADVAFARLGAAGTYYLIYDGQIEQTAPTTASFTLHRAARATAAMALDTPVTGTLEGVGDQITYSFTLSEPAQVLVDSLSARTDLRLTLAGPGGTLVDNALLYLDGDYGASASVLSLAAGTYRVTIAGAGRATGDFAFALRDLATAAALDLGTRVDVTLDPANAMRLFRFDGAAGDQFYLDYLEGAPNGQWKVVNRFGQVTGAVTNIRTDIPTLTLTADGPHYLILDPRANDTGVLTTAFRLVPLTGAEVATALDETIEGTIALPGQQARHTFTLDDPTRLLVDVLAPVDGSWRWTLTGPRGQVDSRTFTSSDSVDNALPPLYDLPAGDYVLTIAATGGATGDYAFALLDTALAKPITLGTTEADQLAPGSETKIYRFEATAGDRYFFNVVTGNSQSSWRLIDPYGREVFDEYLADVDTTTLLDSGTYLLLIEGRIYHPNARDIAFNVFANPITAPVRLTLEDVPSPDLVIDDFTLDTTEDVETGGLVPLSWTVRNAGDLDFTGTFSNRVTIRRQDTGEILADLVVPFDGALPQDGTAVQTASLRLPVGSRAVGALTVTLRLDTANEVDEQNDTGDAETNNSAVLALTAVLAAQPDLVIRDLAPEPAAGWLPGQTVVVGWTVANEGRKAAATPWTERLVITNRATGRVVYAQDIRDRGADLAADETRARTVEFGWPAGVDATGEYDFTVTIDALGEVTEANDAATGETNNTASLRIASAPDLVVIDFAFDVTEAAAGGTVTLTWTLRNDGAAPTPGDWTDWLRLVNATRGTLIHSVAVAGPGQRLLPGESVTRTVTFTVPDGAAGVGTLRAELRADSDTSGRSALNEARADIGLGAENNNYAQVTVASVARPYADLVATITGLPDAPRGGEAATIRWRVENRGAVDTGASAWVDRVYLSRDGVLDDSDILLGEVARSGALAVDAGYDAAGTFTLPFGIEGDVQVIVVADATAAVLEPDTRASNRANGALALSSPYADLTVQAVTSPGGSHVAGAAIDVAWRVANLGPDPVPGVSTWTDRVWLSSDDTLGAGDVLLGSFDRAGPLAVGASYSRSVSVDLPAGQVGNFRIIVETNAGTTVYERGAAANNARAGAELSLSAAPAADLTVSDVTGPDALVPGQVVSLSWKVTNGGEAAARAPWVDGVYLTGPGLGSGRFLGEVTRTFDLAAGGDYIAALDVIIPAVGEGDYRLQVRADHRGQVFEGGREGNNAAATGALGLLHPDLTLAELELDSTAVTSGATVRVTWDVQNSGDGVASGARTDRIWLSRDAVLDADDLLLGALDVTETLLPGGRSVAFTDITVPISASGSWFILVGVDAGAAISEPGGEDNNLGAIALDVTLAPYADLEVTEVMAPALLVNDPAELEITWTVANTGTGRGITETWVDRIWLSRDAIRGNGDDIEVARFTHTGGLDRDDAYTRTETFLLPPALSGRFTLYVTTDADGVVFENGQEADNTRALAGFLDVAPIPYADLVMASVTAPETAQSGEEITLAWRVENRGIGLTQVSRWTDRVFIADNAAGTGRVQIGTFEHLGFLAPGAGYDRQATLTLPDGWEGPAYFFVQTPGGDNHRSTVLPFELVFTDAGNEAVSNRMDVTLSPPPNLVVTAVSAPASAPEGSAIDVTWTVRNDGTGPANGTWTDRLFLRKAGGGVADIAIGSYSYTGPLQAGLSYTRREQITVPAQTNDRYDLIVVTDFGDTVYEHTNEDDNESSGDLQITISRLPRPDLQIAGFVTGDTYTSGATGSLRWTVINQGPVATTVPNWTDTVYLSLDDKITSDDIVLGTFQNESALESGEQYLSREATFRIPERFRGTAFLLVKTDSGNAMEEWPNENNNVGVQEINITPIPFADLVVHDVVTETQAFEGTSVNLTYSITNRGAGATNIGSWAEQIWLTRDKNRPHPNQGDILLSTIQYVDGVLGVGDGYDRTVSVRLPDNLVSGTYYLTPVVDPFGTVLEDALAINVNPDDPTELNSSNYKAGGGSIIGLQIIGNPPDLTAPELGLVIDAVTPVATAGVAGQNSYEIRYTLTNQGDKAAQAYRAQFWLSTAPGLFAANEETWSLGEFTGDAIEAGGSRSFTQVMELPPGLEGNYLTGRVFVSGDTDASNDSDVAETRVRSPEPNLRVTAIDLPPEAFSGEKLTIGYTVTNDSDAAIWTGTQFWRDQIWISRDPTFIRERATYLETLTISNAGGLAGHASYSREIEATLPEGIDGTWYV